jgi:predicted dehydrogenase
LVEAAEKGVKLAVFQNRRWDSDLKTETSSLDGVLGEVVEAEFHFDRYNPLLSPKQTKKRLTTGWNFERPRPHLIDQAVYFALLKLYMLMLERQRKF